MTYIGNVQSPTGLQVAVFLTDKKTVLHGRVGEVVGSRVRVVKIGLESVDVEDLTSGRSQRLALAKKGAPARDATDSKEPRDSKDRDGRDREPGGNSR
jgi:hypothetical protein